MIPLLLQAHTRSLTKVIYNRDGDLLFSASKDDKPNMWRTINGERLGSFNGHRGAVWSLDVTADSRVLASGCADNTTKIWDVSTGKCLHTVDTDTGVRSVAWAMGANGDSAAQTIAIVTDATMGFPSTILIYDVRSGAIVNKILPPADKMKKPTIVRWTDCNESILSGHDDGHVALWDPSTGALQNSQRPHTETVRDLQFNRDRTCFITASKDTTARLLETANLHIIKTYKTERPVNSAAISPIRTEVLVAGGQEALHVTTTSTRSGQFEARFFHEIFENELGRVRGHFGPINTLAYNPTGKGYASGAEDGYIRLHTFDPDYFEFSLTEPDLEEPLL